MDRAEKCFFCGRTSPESDVVAWFVQHERRTTHSACWLEAYRRNRLPVASSAAPGQPTEGTDPASRKTLDDIRRELEAEYPAEPETTDTRVPAAAYLNGDAGVVERHRAGSRRRRQRRHAMAAALGGIAALVVLGVGYVAVTRETIGPGAVAVASAPEVPAAQPAATVLPALLTELDQQLTALRGDLQALAARLERSDSRIAGMESRVGGVESSMRRLADDVASAAATRAAERAVPAPRQAARTPAPAPPLAPISTPVTAADAGRWIPAQHSVPERAPTPPDVRPVAEAIAPSLPQTAPLTTTGPAPARAASAVSDNASPSSAPPTLRDKLRADWRTIKQGFANAGDDFKASMRDLARKVRGE